MSKRRQDCHIVTNVLSAGGWTIVDKKTSDIFDDQEPRLSARLVLSYKDSNSCKELILNKSELIALRQLILDWEQEATP